VHIEFMLFTKYYQGDEIEMMRLGVEVMWHVRGRREM
jgi:hypothetical protein